MVKVTGTYQGDLHVKAVHDPSNDVLETDAPVDNHGKGEAFSPTDLVGTSMGTCMLTIMAIKAQSLGIEEILRGARFEVEKQMSASPRRIGRLSIQFWLPSEIPVEHRNTLEKAALGCPVHHSLHPDIDAPVTFHWE